jgi:hypothetical protein
MQSDHVQGTEMLHIQLGIVWMNWRYLQYYTSHMLLQFDG